MERNTQTIFGELTVGDRFYRTLDKTKTVWEKNEIGDAKQDKDKYAIRMNPFVPVIFLRNKDEKFCLSYSACRRRDIWNTSA